MQLATAVQGVDMQQALRQHSGGSLLPHVGSAGDLLVQQVEGSHALSVLVQQPVYQVGILAGTIRRGLQQQNEYV